MTSSKNEHLWRSYHVQALVNRHIFVYEIIKLLKSTSEVHIIIPILWVRKPREATKLPQDHSNRRWFRHLHLGLCDLGTSASSTDCLTLRKQLIQVAQKRLHPAQSHRVYELQSQGIRTQVSSPQSYRNSGVLSL